MIFETGHSLKEDEFVASAGLNFSFPLHLHRSFELFAQREGTTRLTVDDREYILKAGQSALVFPFQIHAYEALTPGHNEVCIFSPDLVPDFCRARRDLLPADNVFTGPVPNGALADNIYLRRAVAYSVCGAFDKGRRYLPATGNGQALTALLLYADRHFRTECLLRDAAAGAGYDYAYASKLFTKRVGMPFHRYVNLLRVRESRELLRSGEKSVAEIAAACGFGTARTFDRVFRSVTGRTPSACRGE